MDALLDFIDLTADDAGTCVTAPPTARAQEGPIRPKQDAAADASVVFFTCLIDRTLHFRRPEAAGDAYVTLIHRKRPLPRLGSFFSRRCRP